ncbi:NADPH-dependent FMN reductase [Streptoalloteichus hindustanus]|uniref:NAD(P)H-dependent FMN reductase n=1 Tax=Streptoalloteichus hindustanus TaxID=2017 RepID=A0A1M5F027_STRHI|nr:NAD(P)H-dependent oxidoreductase [Streptoalloteichus hindustanus]SHF84885.1 NAD(P)H-dependent FMN reductase [Streptoalloteichus hindustanus]
MATNPLRLAVIVGSVREGRFGPTVANWITDQARGRADWEVEVIDLAEIDLPMSLRPHGSELTPEAARALSVLTPGLDRADAFVVVTPEYNHSFPASLKNAIDWHNRQWHAKPVAFVSYGAISGGLRAVEQLRLVFAELHAVTIRDTVSFHQVWDRFTADGQPTDPTACAAAAKTMLDQLAWWARTLRDGRTARPYTV